MTNLLPFISRKNEKGEKALEALVLHYEKLMTHPLANPLNVRQDPWVWGSWTWPSAGRFIKHEAISKIPASTKNIPLAARLPEKTLLEIQAMTLHAYVMGTTNRVTLNKMIRGLLLIENSLRMRSQIDLANFADLKVRDLNNAVEARGNLWLPLASAKRLLEDCKIVTSGAVKNWVDHNHVKKKAEGNRDARSLDSGKREKLPDVRAVSALADYFSSQPWLTRGESSDGLDKDEKNVLVASGSAIFCLVPSRADELISNLSVNGLVRRPDSQVGEVLGITWYADKVAMDHVKWVPYTHSGVFEAVIEEAFSRLKIVTTDARTLLRRWDSQCSEFDAAEYKVAKLENRLPEGWPWFNEKLKLRYSDAMFVCLKHQFHDRFNTVQNVVTPITYSKFRDYLAKKATKNAWTGEPSVRPGFFERIGHEELSLNPDDYNTHAFRHMVNTAARLGGMSEFDINLWSHRRRVGQGEVYNHTTGEQRRNLILHGDSKGKKLTPQEMLSQINHGHPLTRQNMGIRYQVIGNSFGGFTFIHPLGTCIHNYSESPCLRDNDCVMCPENAHCKGDKKTLKNLQKELDDANKYLKMATMSADRRGIDKYQGRSRTLIALVDVLGDESPLADGAIVVLSPDDVPKSGLLERAKMAAEQIKKARPEIERDHSRATAELGIDRELPNEPCDKQEGSDRTGFDGGALIDDLTIDFEDED